jgi:hypothetical protein
VKWLDHWRDPLLCWAVFCADLAHRPGNFLKDNWYVLLGFCPCIQT